MSADVLRKAAALMRERAEAADALGQIADTITTSTCQEFAEHIASWHPTVALAVAEWLDATARELDSLDDPDLSSHPQDGRRTAALAVARVYLGEAS